MTLKRWIGIHLLGRTWQSIGPMKDGAIHVRPLRDSIAHHPTDECICGPTVEVVPRPDGSTGWVITHHSLDGRELNETSRRSAHV